MRSISQIKTIHSLWEWGKETWRSYFICCSSWCSFKGRQKVNWQDLLSNACYFQWKEPSNNVLCSVLHEEEQQGNPNAKETQPSWRAHGKRSWQHTLKLKHTSLAQLKVGFLDALVVELKTWFKFHNAWKHLPSFTKKGILNQQRETALLRIYKMLSFYNKPSFQVKTGTK